MMKMLKASCYGDNKYSSKRIIMYMFALAALFMILVQAFFVFLVIYKWATADVDFEMISVFPDIIWYMVGGIITGIAGINGFSNQNTPGSPEKPDAEEEDLP
jgi:hypothetical protein